MKVVHLDAQLRRVLLVVHEFHDRLALSLHVRVSHVELVLGRRQSAFQRRVLLDHVARLHIPSLDHAPTHLLHVYTHLHSITHQLTRRASTHTFTRSLTDSLVARLHTPSFDHSPTHSSRVYTYLYSVVKV